MSKFEIIVETNEQNELEIKYLKYGSFFCYSDCIYRKTDETSHGCILTVRVSDGVCEFFSPNDLVYEMECLTKELTFKRVSKREIK